MSTRVIVILILLSSLSKGRADESQELKKQAVQQRLSAIGDMGAGVYEIKTDKKGRIVSCVVVGKARISTVVGKTKGLEIAREKAVLGASAEYVRWLKQDVSVYSSSDDETVILIGGTEEGDNESLGEAGKSIEKSSKRMESVAKGLVRGLQVLHKQVNADGKEYTIILGWSAATADAAKGIDSKESPQKPSIEKPLAKTNPAEAKRIDKQIEDESSTSDEAEKFLK